MRPATAAKTLIDVLAKEAGLDLDGLRAECESAGNTLRDLVDSIEASLPPSARQAYADGARSIVALSRGDTLIFNYLRTAPLLAAELGPSAIEDLVHGVLTISPLTSASTLASIIDRAPVAAKCLGSEVLFERYLTIVHHLASVAPRGLPAVLGNLEELLSKVTLSGFLRWIDFGTQAYRHEYESLLAYFELDLSESRAVLERERPGVLLTSVHRRARSYLRALWGRDFRLQPFVGRHPGSLGLAEERPYLLSGVLHVPDGVAATDERSGFGVYQAMATHLACHLIYGCPQGSVDDLDPVRRYFVGIVEDAVVEEQALGQLPGLRSLWGPLADDVAAGSVGHALRASVEYARQAPTLSIEGRPDAASVRAAGLRLHEFARRAAPLPSLRVLQAELPSYRDDNRFLWAATDSTGAVVLPGQASTQVRHNVSPLMMAHTLDAELATVDDADEVWTCTDLMRTYEDNLTSTAETFNNLIGSSHLGPPTSQPEWDYQAEAYRPDWVTLRERRASRSSPNICDDVLEAHKGVAKAIERIVDQLTPVEFHRVRGVEDGDELDLPSTIDAMVAMRSGKPPDQRVMSRNVINHRDLAVLLLLDLSESTNDCIPGTNTTIISLVLDAAVLLATAMEGIGDPFAVHGFASEGRHRVDYVRLKDFHDAFDQEAKGRLAGITAGLSTRMGAGLRHAGQCVSGRGETRKLVLLVTDGEPADVDEADPEYLREDTRKAVQELRSIGVSTHCLTIDSRADAYVEDLFGIGRFTVLDRVESLPAELPRLFAALTR